MSRKHAELRTGDAGFRVMDLGSANGTFVNDVRVRVSQILPGQVVRFGAVAFAVAGGVTDEEQTDQPSRSASASGQFLRGLERVLSPAQGRVFEQLLSGVPEKVIARRLDLSRHTVHNHVRKILNTFGVHSRAELLAAVLNPHRGDPSIPRQELVEGGPNSPARKAAGREKQSAPNACRDP